MGNKMGKDEMKIVSVVDSITGSMYEVSLARGNCVAEVLENCGLSSRYEISEHNGGVPFSKDCDIFPLVGHGDQLVAAIPVVVGSEESLEKSIAVLIADQGNKLHDLKVFPGTTPRDLRAHLDLTSHYQFSKQDAHSPFEDLEDIYESVENGEKITASCKTIVGIR